jgi:hypothetical protein
LLTTIAFDVLFLCFSRQPDARHPAASRPGTVGIRATPRAGGSARRAGCLLLFRGTGGHHCEPSWGLCGGTQPGGPRKRPSGGTTSGWQRHIAELNQRLELASDSWDLHKHSLSRLTAPVRPTGPIQPAGPIRPARRGAVPCVALGSGSRIKAACGCGRGAPSWRLEPAPDDFSLPCFVGCLNRPARTRASPLPCSRASQRSLQVRNAGEWWVWKGKRTAACKPTQSVGPAFEECSMSIQLELNCAV